MSGGDILYGKCDCCGKEAHLERKYFRYPVKCECHSPEHMVIVDHCSTCMAKEPEYSKVTFRTEDLANPVSIAMRILKAELSKDTSPGSYYYGWQSNLACTIMDNSTIDHYKANEIARQFLSILVKWEFVMV